MLYGFMVIHGINISFSIKLIMWFRKKFQLLSLRVNIVCGFFLRLSLSRMRQW